MPLSRRSVVSSSVLLVSRCTAHAEQVRWICACIYREVFSWKLERVNGVHRLIMTILQAKQMETELEKMLLAEEEFGRLLRS